MWSRAEKAEKALIRECLRNIICEVRLRAEYGTGYYEALDCYVRRPHRPKCRFDADCTLMTGFHWLYWNHSAVHPVLQLSLPERARLAVPWELATMKVCKHFSRTGRCLYGDACAFVHSSGHLSDVHEQLDIPLPWDKPQSKPSMSKQRQRRRRPHKHAATSTFRRFLVDTFTTPCLAQGAGVLDVAGGAGVLSYELVNLSGVRSTIVDPRKPKFDAAVRRVAHRRAQLSQAISLHHYDPAVNISSLNGDIDNLPAWSSEWFGPWLYIDGVERPPEARRETWLDKLSIDESSQANKQTKILTTKQLKLVMDECSVVIGLHPDSATEAIVDYALARGKPFAVVPCCVFKKMFPRRRTADGRPIQHYEEFVDYLQAKSPRIQRAELDFVGRNIVLWMDGVYT